MKWSEVPRKLFNRRWWWTTLLVIAGVAFLIRLGLWQLDRLDQRRAFNQMVADRWREEPFDVNANALPTDLTALEFRRVQAGGEFDYANQIVLTGQNRDGAPGVILVTPLVMDDGRAVLVARGWVPSHRSTQEFWPEYDEPSGQPVIGLIQETQLLPNGSAPTPPDTPQVEWFRINIDAIQPQMPYPLLPIFILQLPEEGRAYDALPFREEPLALDEGSHFSYAIQWFMFAMILGAGYVVFIRTQELREQRIAGTLETLSEPSSLDEDAPVSVLPQQQGHA